MKRFYLSIILVMIASPIFVANVYGAQVDYFLKLDGIDGESTAKEMEGWIKLDSVQYRESDIDLLMPPKSQTNRQVDKIDNSLTLNKYVDKSTPALFEALTSGKNLGTGQLNICENDLCGTRLVLSDVYITAYEISSSDTDTIMDSFTIVFSSIGLKQETDAEIPDIKEIPKDTETPGTVIPGWIKNNAKWFADGSIGESDFTMGIEYMIKEKIMHIDKLPAADPSAKDARVPDWIKNNAKWWSEGQIDDNSFVQGIQYLVEHGIIRVN